MNEKAWNVAASDGSTEYKVTARPVQSQQGPYGRSIRFSVWVDGKPVGELRLEECFGKLAEVTVCGGHTKAGVDVAWLVAVFRDNLQRFPSRTTGPGA